MTDRNYAYSEMCDRCYIYGSFDLDPNCASRLLVYRAKRVFDGVNQCHVGQLHLSSQ